MSKLVSTKGLDEKQEKAMSRCPKCNTCDPPIDTGFFQLPSAPYLIQATSVCQNCRTILGVSLIPTAYFPQKKIATPKPIIIPKIN